MRFWLYILHGASPLRVRYHLMTTHGDARSHTICWVFYKLLDYFLSSLILGSTYTWALLLRRAVLHAPRSLEKPYSPALHRSAPYWRGNVEHLAADGYYTSSCLHSAQHAPCEALLCLRTCVKSWLCGRYVLLRELLTAGRRERRSETPEWLWVVWS